MEQHVERMMQEKNELEIKIGKAKKAIEENPFGMDEQQMFLLSEQIAVMENYLSILNNRIGYEESRNSCDIKGR